MKPLTRLNWQDQFKYPGVEMAYRRLSSLTRRPILLHSLSSAEALQRAFRFPTRKAEYIFVDKRDSTFAHSVLHELIHGILMVEGYCWITSDLFNSHMRSVLSNELQHPEVFRRMESYGLDMEGYWAGWGSNFRTALDQMIRKPCGFVDFPQVFTWFFFGQASAVYLSEYGQYQPVLYKAAQAAHEAARAVGCATKEAHSRYLEIFKAHWLRYCQSYLPHNEWKAYNLQAIQESKVRPLIEQLNSNTEEQLVNHLWKRGFLFAVGSTG